MVKSHVVTDARRGSKLAPCRHAALERGLGHIFGHRAVVGDYPRQSVDLALKSTHENRRAIPVADDERGKKCVVGKSIEFPWKHHHTKCTDL